MEWGPRETSLSPTQAQLQPLAYCLSSYHLRGAKVYKHICKLISNQCGHKHSLRVWNTHTPTLENVKIQSTVDI